MGALQITEKQAIEYGLTLKGAVDSLSRTAEVAQEHGDTVASLHRLAAVQALRKHLNSDTARALILSGAGTSYEVAEGGDYKIPDDAKIDGAIKAMQAGYLLSDEAGPHFTVIMGKGGVSMLVKETGHRYKMKKRGCRNIDVNAVADHKQKQASNDKKWEMVIYGQASCVLDGELITVNRTAEFPIKLPCYETDGPDGLEAKARRRLLRDLWAKVSGEFDAIELSETNPDDVEYATQADAPLLTQDPSKLDQWEQTRQAVIDRLKDPGQIEAFNGLWNAISDSVDGDALATVADEIKGAKALFSERDVAELRRFYKHRLELLKA